jgi:hypothetical protein
MQVISAFPEIAPDLLRLWHEKQSEPFVAKFWDPILFFCNRLQFLIHGFG